MATDIRTVDLTLPLPLRKLGNERRAIEEKLDAMKSKYIPEADGVLLKWSDLNVINDKGLILDEQPYVFWKISFTAHVFHPIVGKIVKGVVYRILHAYYVANVMNVFSITVAIPEKFAKDEVFSNIMLETEIFFRIKGSSEGVYRGEIDEECLELIREQVNQDTIKNADKDVYEYAKNFEY